MEALLYCHDNDIIHGDIRPHNILLANKENSAPVKLAGFGCAKRVNGGDFPTMGMSSEYLSSDIILRMKVSCHVGRLGRLTESFHVSPEVALGRPHGKASDIWSAGILLHVLLSGSLPFLGTGDRLRYAICNGELHVCKMSYLNF